MKFPSLVGHRLVDYVEKEKENRDLIFVNSKTSPQDANSNGAGSNQYQIYNQNVTFNFNNNVQNNTQVFANEKAAQAKSKALKPLSDKKGKIEINVKASFQFEKPSQDQDYANCIEEENQYENDFE